VPGRVGQGGEGHLAQEDRRGLDVDALVLHAHRDGPVRLVPRDGTREGRAHDHLLHLRAHAASGVCRAVRVCLCVCGGVCACAGWTNLGLDLLAIEAGIGDGRPLGGVAAVVVPRHLIDAHREDALEVCIDPLRQQARLPSTILNIYYF
jgi:hypothetical protein